MVFAAMGSNFGDFDNDGFLDFYLGTGDPDLSTLVPNRMFKNVAGQRFAEITASSGTGQPPERATASPVPTGTATATSTSSSRWGAPSNGDRYHNILFQNPGQGNHWLTVKLVGKKTNRAAIGARIKVVTAGDHSADRSTGTSPRAAAWGPTRSSRHIGLARADRVGRPGDPLADQRDDPGISRHRRRPGHRGDRVRRRTIGKLDWKPIPAAEMSVEPGTPPTIRGQFPQISPDNSPLAGVTPELLDAVRDFQGATPGEGDARAAVAVIVDGRVCPPPALRFELLGILFRRHGSWFPGRRPGRPGSVSRPSDRGPTESQLIRRPAAATQKGWLRGRDW